MLLKILLILITEQNYAIENLTNPFQQKVLLSQLILISYADLVILYQILCCI